MKVIIAPDKFAGTLSADEVAAAIRTGWLRVRADQVEVCPMSDGGPGFLDSLAAAGGRTQSLVVTGPRREPVAAGLVRIGATTYVESAQACGLHLVAPESRDPLTASTFGVGQLLREAAAGSPDRIVVGLGGSATVDGGAGMLAALGATATDAAGRDVTSALGSGPASLDAVAAVGLGPAVTALAGIDLVIASDVDSPLLGATGAARGFGPQKGADAAAVARLERAMSGWARIVGAASDRAWADEPGAGAAGGLGFALLALGARFVPGTEVVLAGTGLRERIAAADLVITGEGRFDWQSLHGKVVAGLAGAARERGVAVIVLAGQADVPVDLWRAAGIAGVWSVADHAGTVASAMAEPARHLADLAEVVARGWPG